MTPLHPETVLAISAVFTLAATIVVALSILAAGEAEMKIFLENTSVFVAFLAIVAVNLFVLTLPVIGLLWIFGVLK
jgi:hypothetical protein